MESVYVALNLDTDWRHPDNSGWLNVFNHWAWSGMFRVTWAVSAATYGGRFRAFCEQRLNLDARRRATWRTCSRVDPGEQRPSRPAA